MKLNLNGLIYAISYALDCVEGELIGVFTGHSKRVACICAKMGEAMGLTESQRHDLAVCAVMHDNALTQYIAEEFDNKEESVSEVKKLGIHCILGEKNIQKFPFNNDVQGAILYHHENADGTGPFHKKSAETCVYAQLIHFADTLDAACNKWIQEDKTLRESGNDKKNSRYQEKTYDQIIAFLEENEGSVFIPELVSVFKSVFTESEYKTFRARRTDDYLKDAVPDQMMEYSNSQMKDIIDIFAKIIDYKSVFTRNHSMGVAEKALMMGDFYHYDEDTCFRLYVAGALHDIGKLAVSRDILEKPDKLTEKEFVYMQNHAWYTHQILSQIEGFEDITRWASYHHEKLNGEGYPFGKTAEELDKNDRVLACIDIYQALREKRPYKNGLEHDKAVAIMQGMAQKGYIDNEIVENVNQLYKYNY